MAADDHLRIRNFIRRPFRAARHQWGQRGRDIAVPTIEISRIVPARQRIDMTRDEVWQHRQFRKFRFLHTELRPGDSAGYILPDIAQHTLEKSEGFLLLFIRSEEHTPELQSLMRNSSDVF